MYVPPPGTYLAQFGYFELTATTTITVDQADDGRFLAATPFEYTTPVIPALDWTAVGGDVTIAQDAGGHLPQLPVGTGGALRTVTGSVVIDSAFAGGASIFMGCRPGRTSEKRIGPAPVGVQVVATPGATVCAPSTVLVAAIVTDAAVCVTPVALHAPVFATAVDGARRPPDAPPANRRGH